MKKLLSSPEVIASLITVFGTLLVGIILGVAEGKIGFASLLAVVAALALILLVYLLYKRSGPRVTALAFLIMLVVGFAGFTLLRPRSPAQLPSPTRTPTAQVAALPTATPVPPTTLPTKDAPAAPTLPPTLTRVSPKPTATRGATRTPAPAPTTAPAMAIALPDALIGIIIPPGPEPAAAAFANGALWVADNSTRRLYLLDAAGAAALTIELDQTDIKGLAFDGQDLLVAAGNYSKPALLRIDTSGKLVETIPLPVQPIGLGWNPADSSFWTAVFDQGQAFLVHLTRDCGLIETIWVDVFGGPEGLTCGPDGLWITNPFGDVSRYSYSGVKLAQASTHGSIGDLPQISPALDEAGNVYLSSRRGRKIYQFTSRQDSVTSYPTPAWQKAEGTPLPRPALEPLGSAGNPRVRITNGFGVALTVAVDRVGYTDHEAGVLQPSDIWTKDVSPGIYKVFASTSGQGMVTFSSQELLVKGYQFDWVVSPPQ